LERAALLKSDLKAQSQDNLNKSLDGIYRALREIFK
jgi:hypothetical protein